MKIFKKKNADESNTKAPIKNGKPYVVGIAGGTQSGKSTFTKELENALSDVKIKTFHMDDYYKPRKQQPKAKGPIANKEYIDSNQPDALEFNQLRVDIRTAIDEKVAALIIVEGTMILYDDTIRSMLDLKLYVDARADERVVRYIETYSKYYGKDFVRNSYLDLVRYRIDEYVEPTKWMADIILNGSSMSKRAVEIIKAYLASC